MDKIGRYRLTQRIGAGSFATVWQGHDDALDAFVAIKILAENWADNDDVRNRFLSEAKLLRRIQDERIVRVYDIGNLPDERPYYVMDYANGGSLEVLRKNPVAPGRALRLCAEAARALEVLHRHRVIHRDVTPGNILLHEPAQGEIRVLLADLGVAKNMVDRVGATMTAGTPAYMALEQAHGTQLDQRADIYSIAAVTYALLTGKPPFPVKTLSDLLSRDPRIPPVTVADRVGAPPALDALLFAALSSDPNQRPATAEIMATALDQLADVMPGGETYRPRSLSPAEGSILRPAVPGYTTPTSYVSGLGMSPTAPDSASSLAPQTLAGSYLSTLETPEAVLSKYLPEAHYAPQQSKERHAPLFYLWVGLTGVAIFVLTMLIVLWVTG